MFPVFVTVEETKELEARGLSRGIDFFLNGPFMRNGVECYNIRYKNSLH